MQFFANIPPVRDNGMNRQEQLFRYFLIIFCCSVTVSYTHLNMLVLGLIVIVGLGLHLFNFWAKLQLPELMHKMSMHLSLIHIF